LGTVGSGARTRICGFIEELLEAELDVALGETGMAGLGLPKLTQTIKCTRFGHPIAPIPLLCGTGQGAHNADQRRDLAAAGGAYMREFAE